MTLMSTYDARHRRYYWRHRKLCRAKSRAYYQMNGPPDRSAYRKARRHELRKEFLAIYGSKCACCGESDSAFLTLGHVNHDGAEERKTLKDNDAMYRKAIRERDPSRYEVLCMNCNAATQWYGECPHRQTSL